MLCCKEFFHVHNPVATCLLFRTESQGVWWGGVGCFTQCPALLYISCCTPQWFLTFANASWRHSSPFTLQLLVFCVSFTDSYFHFPCIEPFSPSFLPPCSILPSKLVHIPALLVQPVPGTLSNSQPVLISSLSPHLTRILDSINSFPFS